LTEPAATSRRGSNHGRPGMHWFALVGRPRGQLHDVIPIGIDFFRLHLPAQPITSDRYT
jgi:hypothetical protein